MMSDRNYYSAPKRLDFTNIKLEDTLKTPRPFEKKASRNISEADILTPKTNDRRSILQGHDTYQIDPNFFSPKHDIISEEEKDTKQSEKSLKPALFKRKATSIPEETEDKKIYKLQRLSVASKVLTMWNTDRKIKR